MTPHPLTALTTLRNARFQQLAEIHGKAAGGCIALLGQDAEYNRLSEAIRKQQAKHPPMTREEIDAEMDALNDFKEIAEDQAEYEGNFVDD